MIFNNTIEIILPKFDNDKKEIDYLEEKNGKLYGYEIKLGSGRSSGAKLFLDTYPDSEFKVIKKDNYNELIF